MCSGYVHFNTFGLFDGCLIGDHVVKTYYKLTPTTWKRLGQVPARNKRMHCVRACVCTQRRTGFMCASCGKSVGVPCVTTVCAPVPLVSPTESSVLKPLAYTLLHTHDCKRKT